ncbi:response regulator transcription factor [Kutzneria buriramensis]|uniref:LuxR C-terminal-related transcriptional regulator n=1 Tax=Kutzneria buriramensis TaxID=1045776 RepID=UPI001FE34553|nr:response regulator transcription factor [Kutzneria buriramensis]
MVADSQAAARRDVRSVLERSGEVVVVAEADTAQRALEAAARHRPDVLVFDLDTTEISRTVLIAQLLRVAPGTGVLVFSAYDDDDAITSAIHAGARGYLVKNAGSRQLLRTIHAVAAGDVIVGNTVAGRFVASLRQERGPYPFPQLTERERDVLEGIAAGKSNLVIARELSLATKTISNRVSVVFGKLGVADRAQAIVLAREAGLGRR